MPTAAVAVNNPTPGQVPYASLIDLIVLHFSMCSMLDGEMAKQEACRNIVRLIEQETVGVPTIGLSDGQKDIVRFGLSGVVCWSGKNQEWWCRKFNL